MANWKLAAMVGCGVVLAGAAHAQGSGSAEGFSFEYPKESLRMREEGTVEYRVRVSKKGELEACEVTKSSGFPRLDRATCTMLIKHAAFTPKRTAEGRTVRSVREGQMVWKIS